MSLQLTLVIALIFVASCYLSWRGWRAWSKAAKGCAGGCHCTDAAPPQKQSTDQLVSISRDRLDLRNKA